MPQTTGGIELFLGPTALGAPDDLEATIVDFIAGAHKQLLIAVQELDSEALARAIVAAHERNVRVQVILEGDYLVEAKALADPFSPTGPHETNRVLYAALLRAGIDVVSDLNPEIFHQKFIVRDPTADTAAVLTGSTNFTLTDTGHNAGQDPQVQGNNLNLVAVLPGKAIAKLYVAEFERLRSGTFGAMHERAESRPSELHVHGVRVKPVFAPWQGPEMEIMKQMLKAKTSIDFAMFTFTRSSGIDDTMFRLAGELTRLRGVLDRGQGSQTWAATQPLAAAGVELYENRPGNGVRKVHHKLMVIDEQLLIVGSFNYTDPANTLNDENIVVLGDLEETDPAAIAAQKELAAYALAEIQRIITDLAQPVAA